MEAEWSVRWSTVASESVVDGEAGVTNEGSTCGGTRGGDGVVVVACVGMAEADDAVDAAADDMSWRLARRDCLVPDILQLCPRFLRFCLRGGCGTDSEEETRSMTSDVGEGVTVRLSRSGETGEDTTDGAADEAEENSYLVSSLSSTLSSERSNGSGWVSGMASSSLDSSSEGGDAS